ncbi:MAG TPA: hypothetical protein VHE83_17465 [Mycobacteriales bacterium]|nr:hypothetical protein [Mycobacteriales bacterium]
MSTTSSPTSVVLRGGTWVDGDRLAAELGPEFAVDAAQAAEPDVVVLAADHVREERALHPEASLVALLPSGAPTQALVAAYEDGADVVLAEASGRELVARVRAAARRRTIIQRTRR